MSWWRKAKAGDKIVCIEAMTVADPDCRSARPVIGGVYEITDVVAHPFVHWRGCNIYFSLKGYDYDELFVAYSFRPVDPASKKADRGLAALKDGIKTVREREPA